MAIEEADTARVEGVPAGGPVYDGFISYSHAADDLLAPRLQAGLQRFAKPWWKRRALRIFRDESSLSANPHLWASITDALDQSAWFVLLLSPEAAGSEWVNEEVAYWLEHKDPGRIIPLLTDGEFGWLDGDVAGDAVPPALLGVFAEEPRWVDMRFARSEEQLDLQNPTFSAAVADIAAAMHGVPKDELASEEVRQHRRNVRTAWAAGAALLLLAVAAVGFGVRADQQADLATTNAQEAETQRRAAEANAAEADSERDRAQALAQSEADARAAAETSEALARSQELAAASTSVLESAPELASLLAVRSIQEAPGEVPPESIRALRKADQANLLRDRIELAGESFVSITPDGSSLIAFSETSGVASFDLATGEENWRTSVAEHFDEGTSTALSPDGSLALATGVHTDSQTGVLLVLSLSDGEITEVFTELCPRIGWQESGPPFSPDGSVLALVTGTAACQNDPEQSWVSFRDTSSWQEVGRLQVPGFSEVVQFGGDEGHFLLTDIGGFITHLELRSYPTMELLQTFNGYAGRQSALSPDGGRVAYDAGLGVRIHAADTGEFLGWVEGQGRFLSGTGLLFSPDGASLLVISEGAKVLVDSSTGKLLARLGSTRANLDGAFTPDGRSVVTSDRDRLEIWDLDRTAGSVPLFADGTPVVWVNPDRMMDGLTPAVHVYAGTFPSDMITWLLVIDPQTGQTVDAIQTPTAAQLPDGRFISVEQSEAGTITEGSGAGQTELAFGGLSIWNPGSGTMSPITECSVLLSETGFFDQEPPTPCPDGEPAFGTYGYGGPWIRVSPDGSLVAADSGSLGGGECTGTRAVIRVWDVTTSQELFTLEIDGCEGLMQLGNTWAFTEKGAYDLADGSQLAEHDLFFTTSQLTADGRYVIGVGAGPAREVVVIDTEDWSEVARWGAHETRIRGVAISENDQKLTTTGTDGVIRVWDLDSILTSQSPGGAQAPLLDEIPIGVASDALWIDNMTLGVAFIDGGWTTVSLDPQLVVEHVLSRLQRSFTITECQTYRIDPCPTLNELREG